MSIWDEYAVDQPGEIGFRVKLYIGRDLTLRVTIKSDSITDISGANLWLSAKKNFDDSDASAVITKSSANPSEAAVVDATNKVVEFYFVPGDTVGLDPGDYVCDAVIEIGGKKYQLLEPFYLEVRRSVTVSPM